MERQFSLNVDVSIKAAETTVLVERDHVATWALELGLLLCDQTEAIIIASSDASLVLSLQHTVDPAARHTLITRAPRNTIRFTLTRNQAEYLQAVFLRAYRDGMAEVEHVHLEGTLDGAAYDLTILFRVARPPMSAEDAARLLED